MQIPRPHVDLWKLNFLQGGAPEGSPVKACDVKGVQTPWLPQPWSRLTLRAGFYTGSQGPPGMKLLPPTVVIYMTPPLKGAFSSQSYFPHPSPPPK